MKDVVVETKRPRKSLPSLSSEQVRQAIGPIIDQVPSQKAALAEPRTIDDFERVINAEWHEAQDRFLSIGELLDRAERTLPQPEYMMLCERLPFGKATRSQLLTAYRCIKSGKIPAAMATAGYSTLYQAAQLTDEEVRQAAEDGLLRADVKRTELIEFRRRIRGATTGATDRKRGRFEYRRPEPERLDTVALRARRDALLAELAEIERLLTEAGESV
jgi:hypothetical protein